MVALRGTDGFVEWAEDGQFVALPYAPYIPLPDDTKAKVEQGFWGVYQTLQLTDLQGKVLGPLPTAIPALATAADEIVVVGHSLGAALAAYMTIELARTPTLANRVNGIFYALPHPGDQAFADLFHSSVPDYMVYNYILDLVPRVPPSLLGYAPLPKTTELHPETAQASIRLGLACSHHIICYLAMIDWNRMEPLVTNPPANAPEGEESSVMCVKGQNLGYPSVAKSIVAHIEQHV